MKCRYCGEREAVEGVFCQICWDTHPDHLTVEQYLEALHKIRDGIAKGEPMKAVNSDALGDKYNYCTWGVCTNSAEVWSRPEMHIWPMDFIERGRVAPLTCPSKCPLDAREEEVRFGCFYKCLAFRPPRNFILDRRYALILYDTEIRKLEETL